MANYGIKVENVLSKFYSVKQDEAIKGLYIVVQLSRQKFKHFIMNRYL